VLSAGAVVRSCCDIRLHCALGGMPRSTSLLLATTLLGGCVADPSSDDCVAGDLTCSQVEGKADTTSGGMPLLPAPGGQGALTPWAGTDATRCHPEAILDNATSQSLNQA